MARLRGTVAFVTQRGERFARYVYVVKGNGFPFDYLRFFMAFPREQYDVAGRCMLNCQRDCLPAVGLHGIFHSGLL
jgi:hypothetical protein